MSTLDIGKRVINHEAEALAKVAENLDATFDSFIQAIENCAGKLIIIGMGKSGHVAKKMAATMSSLGTCAICVHPGECMHGDLGMIQSQDVVILISYSGESDEIKGILPGINRIGAKMLGITFNGQSTLARNVSVCQVFAPIKEACHIGLAPTTSTTIVMAYGDALAVAISESQGFTKEDFAVFHPAGTLGKRIIIRSKDLMVRIKSDSLINEESTILDAMNAMIDTGLSIAIVEGKQRVISRVISSEEIKSILEDGANVNDNIGQYLKKKFPVFIDESSKAVEALQIMADNDLETLPIVNEEKVIGAIRKQDIIKAGITL